MHCGQDVPWTASAKDGRLVCSRCGISPENPDLTSTESDSSGHVPLNIPINDLHGAHHSGPSVPLPKDFDQSESAWPVASAYDGWNLDEQLSHIRQVLDSISVPADDADQMLDADLSASSLPKAEHRFDAMHSEKRGLHRRTPKRDPLMGHFVFGLTFLMLGTGLLVLSIASILPRQIWFPADVPIAAVLLQVFGVFLTGLGLSAQLRRFQAALAPQEPNRQRRRFDEPQFEHKAPHVDVKVRS